MILAYLYESLGESVDLFRAYKVESSLLFEGPLWLLQLWLNITFEASLPKKDPIDEEDKVVINKIIEGMRLALLTPRKNEDPNPLLRL